MRRTPRLVLAVLLTFPFFVRDSSAQDKSLHDIVHKLQAVHTSEADFPQYEVPEAARPLLFGWKRGIREVIAEVLSDPSNSSRSVDALRNSIQARLKGEEVELAPDKPQYYGQPQKLDLKLVENIPGLLTVVSSVWIGCGADSSLYVFQKGKSGWNFVLALTSADYAQINGGIESLHFELSNLGGSADWYLVAAFSHPWCTSCRSGVKYKVLRPSGEPDKPLILYEGEGGLYRCADPAIRVRSGPEEFSLSYVDAMIFDFDLFAKVAVDHFSIRGGQIRRIPPVRQNAADFVDQWLRLRKGDAALLVLPGGREQAMLWHLKLSAAFKGTRREGYETSYEWEQSCAEGGTRRQIKMDLSSDTKGGEPGLPPALYFTLEMNSEGLVFRESAQRKIQNVLANESAQ
jgi:hypothetical protein